jgi:hypothetical protein
MYDYQNQNHQNQRRTRITSRKMIKITRKKIYKEDLYDRIVSEEMEDLMEMKMRKSKDNHKKK